MGIDVDRGQKIGLLIYIFCPVIKKTLPLTTWAAHSCIYCIQTGKKSFVSSRSIFWLNYSTGWHFNFIWSMLIPGRWNKKKNTFTLFLLKSWLTNDVLKRICWYFFLFLFSSSFHNLLSSLLLFLHYIQTTFTPKRQQLER